MANSLEKKKYFFIYKTINLINGKYYIGKHCTSNLKDGYIGSGTVLRRSIRKYGKENFKCEILEYLQSHEDLKVREREIVNEELIKDSLCMNLQLGGGGGFISDEHKVKFNTAGNLKQRWLSENDPEWKEKRRRRNVCNGKQMVELGVLKNWSFNYSWKGKHHSEETKKKKSELAKNKGLRETNSQFGTMWITNGTENKKIKKEQIIPLGFYKGRV
jgi:hypothetical protein